MREKPTGKESNWRWEFRGRKLVLEMGEIPLGKRKEWEMGIWRKEIIGCHELIVECHLLLFLL
jgi:hypothetical protein